MRSSMTESRLTSLALIRTPYDTAVDPGKAVDLFAAMNPRRMQLLSVLDC